MSGNLIEIERKFLVLNDGFYKHMRYNSQIVQGYFVTENNLAVRVGKNSTEGYVTFKGNPSKSGATRFEWEKEITLEEADHLLALCPNIVRKLRNYVQYETHLFEVDVFLGKNLGLVVAEVELKSEDEEFPRPDWLGKEVTQDFKYHNAYLSKNPYMLW